MKLSNDQYITGLKVSIQSIPYFGVFLDQFLFEHRGRIKQNRLNKFIQNLIDYFETEADFEYNGQYVRSDEFGDLFESIIERVVKTDNSDKLERFKYLIKNQIFEPRKVEYIESFIDLIPKITEKQFEILLKHMNYGENFFHDFRDKGIGKFNKTPEEIAEEEQREIEKENLMNLFLFPTSYSLSESEYKYLIQDLISKSLIADVGIGGIGIEPFEIVRITEFGLAFIKYVSEN